MKKNLIKTVVFLSFVLPTIFCGPRDTGDNGEPPDAPYLFVQTVSDSQIYLKIHAYSEEIVGIAIERSLGDESNYSQIVVVSPVWHYADYFSADYNDIGLQSETRYYYRAWAYNDYGNSAYSTSKWATTFIAGFAMCSVKTSFQYFPCLRARCPEEKTHNRTATGAEVFDCLELQLVAPAIMTVFFDYRSSASSECLDRPQHWPYFEVIAGAQSEKFSFSCVTSGSNSISISVLAGLTIDDISFKLASGDWGSSVAITAITFTP